MENQRAVLCDKDIKEITQYWDEGVSKLAICEMIGITPRRFDQMRHTILRHLKTRAIGSGPKPTLKDPTPEEIAERAAEIRSRWTPEAELIRRAGWGKVNITDKSRVKNRSPSKNASTRGIRFYPK